MSGASLLRAVAVGWVLDGATVESRTMLSLRLEVLIRPQVGLALDERALLDVTAELSAEAGEA